MLYLVLPAAGWAAVDPLLKCPEIKAICVQADRAAEIDLGKGTAALEGNVVGYVKADDLNFRAGSLKAFRDDKQQWVRLVLDRRVRMHQPGRKGSAERIVLERDWIRLTGNARLESAPRLIAGEEIFIEKAERRTTIKGTAEQPLLIRFRDRPTAGPPHEEPAAVGRPEEQAGSKTGPTVEIRATLGVFDEAANRIELSGAVSVIQADPELRLAANLISLEFDDRQKLTGFRAEGGVKIVQADRTLESDIALTRNDNETILLIGNAKISLEGEFQLASDRIEVYTDVKKGVVRSGKKGKPITLSFDTAPAKTLRLDREGFQALSGAAVPRDTLNKLTPLLGRTFAARAKFKTAARELLSQAEARAYLDTIADQAE